MQLEFYNRSYACRWAKSMRKDVECTFGILKGRFRILKTGIRLKSFQVVDDIWFTCCALHNYLLEADGPRKQWTKGIPSDYETHLGEHDNYDTVRSNLHPEIFGKLQNPLVYDSTTPVLDYVHGDDSDDLSILNISFESMRSKLVDNFHHRWLKQDIKWPSRTGITRLV
jgi:Plant transposon protein